MIPRCGFEEGDEEKIRKRPSVGGGRGVSCRRWRCWITGAAGLGRGIGGEMKTLCPDRESDAIVGWRCVHLKRFIKGRFDQGEVSVGRVCLRSSASPRSVRGQGMPSRHTGRNEAILDACERAWRSLTAGSGRNRSPLPTRTSIASAPARMAFCYSFLSPIRAESVGNER